ncbi:antibiotic biosynthesis monooxygenase [Nocardioides dilutus]
MFARSVTVTGSPGAIDEGITYIRDEVQPTVTQMDGCAGMSLVVDRSSGRCIVTSSWETREAMQEAADRLAPLRSRGAEIMGGEPMIDEWEIAIMHRDHSSAPEACCRITWGRPPDMDRHIEMFRSEILPRMEETEGFCSASMFVDRSGGRMCGTMTFDSQSALEATRERAAMLREQARAATGIEFLDIGEFELVLAHLHVPELV